MNPNTIVFCYWKKYLNRTYWYINTGIKRLSNKANPRPDFPKEYHVHTYFILKSFLIKYTLPDSLLPSFQKRVDSEMREFASQ